MSASEKVSHVRFRDDADLVEFEGCSKVRTEELHSTSTSHKTEISVAINGLEITKKKPEEDEIKLKYFSAFQVCS